MFHNNMMPDFPRGFPEWKKPPRPERIPPVPMSKVPMPRPGGIRPKFPTPIIPRPQPPGKIRI